MSIYVESRGTTTINTSHINQQRTSYSLRSRILPRRRAISVPVTFIDTLSSIWSGWKVSYSLRERVLVLVA
ncbi:hypothetical protein [Vibrio tasmaniensis]|uniref:hypothetical protein n=1 Tax=Vibrio tasmaniensis TaxID=212663 RepID=UPI00111A5449|nr:hypothetical protein [Vibrio tasmaniensis]